MHTYHIYTVQFCRFWSPITDLRHFCACGVNLAVFLGLGLFDGLTGSAMGQKTLKISRFALLGWLAVLVGIRRKKKQNKVGDFGQLKPILAHLRLCSGLGGLAVWVCWMGRHCRQKGKKCP
jgi:hypothetical protein